MMKLPLIKNVMLSWLKIFIKLWNYVVTFVDTNLFITPTFFLLLKTNTCNNTSHNFEII